MTRPSLPSVIAALVILVAAALFAAAADAQAGKPKRGGILNSVLTEDPPGLLVHESATISNVWPMSSTRSSRSTARRRSSPSWRKSGRGRTTTGTSSFSCAGT